MLISLADQTTSVTVSNGEKVTVRIEESSINGLLWSSPYIEGDGLALSNSRSLIEKNVEYREFVFTATQPGKNLVSATLKQAGLEDGIKRFLLLVCVTEVAQLRN